MMASFVLTFLIMATIVTGNELSNIDDAEVDRLLNKLNKPALMSIKSPDGDIIDCVHMKNHPIYDHPLFKNHTIQYSILVTKGRFHGGKAIISTWKPYIQTPREFSLAQIWLASGVSNTHTRDTNTIEAGWQADGYKDSGCYNLKCPGFVHVNRDFAIGAAVRSLSRVGGAQHEIPTSIYRDTRSGHWWLKVYDNIFVGYWPSSLFTTLKDVATDVHWGGEITNNRDGSKHTTTNMGSGHFAEEGYEKASYFKNIEIVDEGEFMKPPVGASPFMSEENCYNIKLGTDVHWGTYFFFGGPGRNAKCK
ncbi:hypothetical protein HA466_0073000 [Hirschfeldia incana]|nr:hypothetical protein HA466_0073000 [Hirschfeldia incana]